MSTKQPIADALRAAIKASGKSFKALEREAGVTRQSLMAFAKGQRTLRLDIADKLMVYFGLDVKPKRKQRER